MRKWFTGGVAEARPGRRFRPGLEALEGRDCPAAPVITAFDATIVSDRLVSLTGQVTDEDLSSVMISFGGAASGGTRPDAQGNFALQVTADRLGTIEARAFDREMLFALAQDTITSPAPTISLSVAQAGGKNVRITGLVIDDFPGGLSVMIGGVASGSVVTNADGTFSLLAPASSLGTIYAHVSDCWMQSASTSATLTNTAPVIQSFEAIDHGDRVFTFRGRVVDEAAAGLTVRLGGIPSLANQTVRVDSDGWFCLVIQLGENEIGTATADVTDWWGAAAQTALALVW